MRWKNKRKTIVLLALFSTLLLFGGWGKKKVELIMDGKLIDLEKAIENASIGAEQTDQEENSAQDEEEKNEITVPDASRTFIVTIHGKQILINGNECSKDKLPKLVTESCTSGDRLSLIDDYAEAHIYHEVDGILEGLSNRIGYVYEAE